MKYAKVWLLIVPSDTAVLSVLSEIIFPSPSWLSWGNRGKQSPLTMSNLGWSFSSGFTKCSISAIGNSRTRSNPLRGAISLRNPVPVRCVCVSERERETERRERTYRSEPQQTAFYPCCTREASWNLQRYPVRSPDEDNQHEYLCSSAKRELSIS